MKISTALRALFSIAIFFSIVSFAKADALTLTSGNNATTTPNVATSITGFQIVGNAASTTPVKLHVTSGTLHVSTVSGVTMSGNDSDTINLSGTVTNLNTALSSLTYTRSSTGTDTLEVALVNSNQIFFETNGHVYQYVASSLDWNAAKLAAEQLNAYGKTGYLVTITSAAENNFVKLRLSGDAWIGASDSGTEGTWKWVTGPEAGTTFWSGADNGSTVGGNYASWGGGEPNNSGDEDCGEEYVASGTWNDLPCSGTTIDGYVAEFGDNTSSTTVVSKNVSIVTADVPAVTSLSPSTGATNASPSANLVIGFSKTVTRDTGSILIKKTSDDSLIETIAVSGALVTGSGSNTITINPAANLAEGVQYYIIVPNTAFKDSSNNYYAGISATSTWSFTTADQTAPTISSVSATSTASTSASITWTTNESGSSKVVYSTGLSFGSTTTETDTSPRITSHSKSVSNLIGCTSYNYKVVSADASGNYATSSSDIFTTLGCSGGAIPSSATTSSVTVSSAATSTLSDSGRTLSVSTPANFTATSSSVTIQIRAQSSQTVLSTLGSPASLSSAASVVFDVTALINNTTVLDSFDSPVTISYTYTDTDISGLNESTLSMYHYHSNDWSRLNNCSVDTSANTITCDTPSFSTFAIFGSALSSQTSSNSSHSSVGSVQQRVQSLTKIGNIAQAENLKKEWPDLFPVAVSTSTIRDLTLKDEGNDVKKLQEYLIGKNSGVAAGELKRVGATGYFGRYTQAALSEYQKINNIVPAVGYFGPLTRAKIKSLDVRGLWW